MKLKEYFGFGTLKFGSMAIIKDMFYLFFFLFRNNLDFISTFLEDVFEGISNV